MLHSSICGPVSCNTVVVVETAVYLPVKHLSRFACVCSVEEQTYPQGQGRTKKEAKTNAAKIAFRMILGLDKAEEDDGTHCLLSVWCDLSCIQVLSVEDGTLVYDSMGRKITVQSESLGAGDGHSVTAVDRETDDQQVLRNDLCRGSNEGYMGRMYLCWRCSLQLVRSHEIPYLCSKSSVRKSGCRSRYL